MTTKLQLRFDDLKVESFETTPQTVKEREGTVFGLVGQLTDSTCLPGPCEIDQGASCGTACPNPTLGSTCGSTCGGTCGSTCGNSCGGTCGTVTCGPSCALTCGTACPSSQFPCEQPIA